MFENKKILITGGTGHLGSATIHYLVSHKNVLPQNIRVFYLKNTPTFSLQDIAGLEFYEGDILNKHDVKAACSGVQLILHIAGSTTFDSRKKLQQWMVNVEGTRNVLEAVGECGSVEKICYVSTVNVLAAPLNELGLGNEANSDPYMAQHPLHSFKNKEEVLRIIERIRTEQSGKQIGIGYFDSKLAAQELVNDFVRKRNLNLVSVMPGTMFGPYDYLIGNGMYVLALYQNRLPAVLNGGLPLVHVMDVARGLTLALENGKAGEQYILSGFESDNRSLKEMAGIITNELRQKFPNKTFVTPFVVLPYWLANVFAGISELISKATNRPMLLSKDAVKAGSNFMYYSSSKAKDELGYIPEKTFSQAVRDMIDYYSQHQLLGTRERYIDNINK